MKLRSIILLVSMLISSTMAFSQATSPVVDSISAGGAIIINVPEALLKRLCPPRITVAETVDTVVTSAEAAALPAKPAVSAPAGKMGGYRIQVFSDNNSRTAKSEARSRARDISAQFPQYATYVVYNAPYWRLRVGNFRTQEEANAAAHSLKAAFPSYSREIRVVKDTIILSGE